MLPFPLTKAFAGALDLAALAGEIAWLGPAVLQDQAQERAWEYGLAIRAYRRWCHAEYSRRPLTILDVGGAGSAFGETLRQRLVPRPVTIELVDPHATTTLEARDGPPADVICAISVIEHTPDPQVFLQALARNLLPGGLAFLTMDGWDKGEVDRAHFHWMRERIYTPTSWRALAVEAVQHDLCLWGGVDWAYHGDQIYHGPTGYTFFSLCLQKATTPCD